jgi:hypothetical protein
MIDPKIILKNFSDAPITIQNFIDDGYNIHEKEFFDSFLWLKSEQMIKPLVHNSYGISVGADGMPAWSVVDLIITSKGKDYLNPPKPYSEPVSKWLFKPIAVAVLTIIICTPISYYMGTIFSQETCEEVSK